MFGDRERCFSIARERVDYLHGKGYAGQPPCTVRDEVGGLRDPGAEARRGSARPGRRPQVNPMVGLTQIMKPVTKKAPSQASRLPKRQPCSCWASATSATSGVQPRDGRHDLRRHRRKVVKHGDSQDEETVWSICTENLRARRQPMSKARQGFAEKPPEPGVLSKHGQPVAKTLHQRHSLQARDARHHHRGVHPAVHLHGLFVFVPALAAAVGADTVFAIRMSHRIIGVVFVAVPLISLPCWLRRAWRASSRTCSIVGIPTTKKWMMLFFPYLFMAKWIHMPDQREVKSGSVSPAACCGSPERSWASRASSFCWARRSFDFGAGVHGVTLFLHDMTFC